MRRDLAYFYPAPVQAVYNAYSQTALQQFGKNCQHNPPYSLSFGLNYSFKYNMNGGSCTIHFMPYQNGTAINIRYTIIQAFGARYGKHAEEMNAFAASILRANPQPINLDVNMFTSYAASGGASQQYQGQYMDPQNAQQPQNPQQAAYVQNAQPAHQAPVNQPVNQAGGSFCVKCGSPLGADSRFCTRCGNPVGQAAVTQPVCPRCGRVFKPDEGFCVQCGTKRPQ